LHIGNETDNITSKTGILTKYKFPNKTNFSIDNYEIQSPNYYKQNKAWLSKNEDNKNNPILTHLLKNVLIYL